MNHFADLLLCSALTMGCRFAVCFMPVLSSLLLALAPSVPVVMLARLLAGAGQQACGVGRQAFCAGAVATNHRGRVVGLLGGVARIGGVAGPLIGGFMAQQYGYRAAFVLQVRLLASTDNRVLVVYTRHLCERSGFCAEGR